MSKTSIIFVVDDDPGSLESLRWMLEQANLCVKAFRSSREFLNAYRPEETGCVVLDVRLPEMDGLALQQILRERKIRLPIIFVTAYGDVPTCARAFRAGAAEFLEKPINDKVLLDRIQELITQQSAEHCDINPSRDFGDRLNLLTPAEAKVMEELMECKSIKDIAQARGVTLQSIYRHQASIFQKVGVENQFELVRIATEWRHRCG